MSLSIKSIHGLWASTSRRASVRSLSTCKSRSPLALPSSSSSSSSFSPSTLPELMHQHGSFIRPYHVSYRTLEQRQSSAAVPPPFGNDTNTKDASTTVSQKNTPAIDDDIQPQQKNPIPPNTDPKARMLIGFTCTVCQHRSHKTMSKHAYEHGVVIMQCDHCKNRHLIADHLGWFKNGGVTVEDLVKERGETVQKLTRSYELIKDGEHKPSSSSSSGSSPLDPSDQLKATKDASKPKTELELALEKASEGMLEWIPKEILNQEEERMKKSLELVDHTKKKV